MEPTTPKSPRMPPSGIDVRPLSPGSSADLLAFFEGDAFADNPKWSSCYCQCFYEDHSKIPWSSRTAPQNRDAACRRIGQGTMQGFLAYCDGRVIGWCNAAPRPLLHALDGEPIADATQVGTILCFLVAPSERGRGVASTLLAAACDGMRARGLQFVEATPRPDATSMAENHYGPLRMYLAAGFSVHRTDADGSVWVRRSL
jgi:GNAT superfamily N-acetyltransferase